jgi:hypothetical protein
MRHRVPVCHGGDRRLAERPCRRLDAPVALKKPTAMQQEQYAEPGCGECGETEAKLGQRRAVRVGRPDRGVGHVRCHGDSKRDESGDAPRDPRHQSIGRGAGHGIGTHHGNLLVVIRQAGTPGVIVVRDRLATIA